jgi:anti-anti-sigma factor
MPSAPLVSVRRRMPGTRGRAETRFATVRLRGAGQRPQGENHNGTIQPMPFVKRIRLHQPEQVSAGGSNDPTARNGRAAIAWYGVRSALVIAFVILTSCLTIAETPAMVSIPHTEGQKPMVRLRVSENRRFLITEDGKPFFYLGDTAWELFHRLNREEVIRYLDTRAAQGFNVIQAVALAEVDGLTEPNAYGKLPLKDRDPTRPAATPGSRPANEEYDYWDHVDFVFDEAQETSNRRSLQHGRNWIWVRVQGSHGRQNDRCPALQLPCHARLPRNNRRRASVLKPRRRIRTVPRPGCFPRRSMDNLARLDLSQSGPPPVYRLCGAVTIANADRIQTDLHRALAQHDDGLLVLEMSSCDFLDGEGIKVLLSAQRTSQRLVLAAPSESLRYLLIRTRLDRVLLCFATVEDARIGTPDNR